MKLAPPRPERADPPPATGEHWLVEGEPGATPRARSPRAVRLLKGFAILLGVAGVLALTDGVLTLVWQEPISGLIAHFNQARLAQNLKRLEAARATPAEEAALATLPTDSQRMALFARKLQQTARDGQAVGRIRIPRIGADFVVVAGTDESALEKGPGIYSGTAVPGLRGTVGIAGHRTTYLAPFRRINELVKGDRITLEMPYGLFSYQVLGHEIVAPNDVNVLRRQPYDQVVLTACNPLYSAAQRIVVFARLTADAPAGPALAGVRPPAVAPVATIPAAAIAAEILGDAAPAGAAPPAPIDPATVLVGGAPTTSTPPARPAPRRASARRVLPRVPVSTGASTPRQAVPTVSPQPIAPAPAPVVVAPRVPAPAPVREPTPAPVRRPAAVKAPAASSPTPTPTPAPTDTTKPADSSHAQARVYGGPGGPAPIIAGN